MTLPVPNLDDRRFQDLVDEAKRRIPEHCPEWTNHNVADPGVALIELFAWMTEISLYRMNQVPDLYYTEMLNLVGIQPFPARAARTDVVFWLVGPLQDRVVVPAGTEVATAGEGGSSVIFSTLEEVVIDKPELVAALSSIARTSPRSVDGEEDEGSGERFVDVWENLHSRLKSLRIFQTRPLRVNDCFYLGFRESMAGLAIELQISADKEGRGVVPTDPPLAWEAWDGTTWAPCTVEEGWDDTGGLNRPGSVVMVLPRKHEPKLVGSKRAHWIRARLVQARPGQRPYEESPEIKHLQVNAIGGTATAEHSETITDEYLGVATAERTPTVLRTRRTPVLPREPGETIQVSGWEGPPWTEVRDFGESGKDDPHFTWDSITGEIAFGPRIRYPDGSLVQHGASPPAGSRISVTRYRTGGGDHGNVGPRTLTTMRTTIGSVARVENPSGAEGGVDAETVENVKRRGPMTLRSGGRAVTLTDFERLTKEADQAVARVRAIAPERAGEPLRVLVVPTLSKPPEQVDINDYRLPEDMEGRIRRMLDARRLLGAHVQVRSPFFQGVTVAALVRARSGAGVDRGRVRERCLGAVYRYLDPVPRDVLSPAGNVVGHRPGWAYGHPLTVASLVQLLEEIEGVERVDDVLLYEWDPRHRRRIGPRRESLPLTEHHLFLSYRHQVVVR